MDTHPIRKNPSREQCEKMIKRILITEVLEKGRNEHFKTASDFMSYFQSLYPASDALTKQVQRAIKSMDMPKDENGYFIINKTSQQLDQERELKYLFQKGSVSLTDMSECETVLLKTEPSLRNYLLHTLSTSITLENKFETMLETCNGILIYTKEKEKLLYALNTLLSDKYQNYDFNLK